MAVENCAKCGLPMSRAKRWFRCSKCKAWFCEKCQDRFCLSCRGLVRETTVNA